MGLLPARMSVHHAHAVPIGARRGHRIPGAAITDCCEQLWRLGTRPGPSD